MTYPWAIVIASIVLSIAAVLVTGLRWSAKVSVSNNDLEIKKFVHHFQQLQDLEEEGKPNDSNKL